MEPEQRAAASACVLLARGGPDTSRLRGVIAADRGAVSVEHRVALPVWLPFAVDYK